MEMFHCQQLKIKSNRTPLSRSSPAMQISSISPSQLLHTSPSPSSDPLLPWLRSIEDALVEFKKNPADSSALARYTNMLRDCLDKFSEDRRYRNDRRLAEVLGQYGDATQDFNKVLILMENKGIGIEHSILYEMAALFYISKGKLLEAQRTYLLGISRNAQPIKFLRDMYASFLDHCTRLVSHSTSPKQKNHKFIDPWSPSTRSELLKRIDPQIVKYNGFYRSSMNYSGKVPLASLQKNSRNRVIELGKRCYHIKGCSGRGGFAVVFKACIDGYPEEVVALKIQQPAFPWEFYMYRQLDKRISDTDRSSFGFAHEVHVYADWSILVCDYSSLGTLQDAVNSYLVTGKCMEEILCMYYTVEMLRMLETLHNAGIIHGDFKPDNLLVRYSRDALTENEFASRTGPWREQGLCLIDWGKGIDLHLFPDETEFQGDCTTSGFRCVQMQEKQPWKFQVDTYALCVNVHMMLHGRYMTIEKKITPEGGYYHQPSSPLKRYWNTGLWGNLFYKLLNINANGSDVPVLQDVRKSFEQHMCESPQLIHKVKELLVKQKASLCSA